MARELSSRIPDELELEFPPRAVNWRSQYAEEDAAYRIEMRMASVRRIAKRAVNAVVDTHEHIDARAGLDPTLERLLRPIEETISFCSAELIARYMGRPS